MSVFPFLILQNVYSRNYFTESLEKIYLIWTQIFLEPKYIFAFGVVPFIFLVCVRNGGRIWIIIFGKDFKACSIINYYLVCN